MPNLPAETLGKFSLAIQRKQKWSVTIPPETVKKVFGSLETIYGTAG
jgi:hypothetical protein